MLQNPSVGIARRLSWLLLLLLLLPCLAGAAAPNESFHESLSLRPLIGGRVHAAFSFKLKSDDVSSIHHFHILPRALLQPVASLGVDELRLSLNKGRWVYEDWGSPMPGTGGDDAVASGAEIWALMSNVTDMWPRWRVLTSALASVSCASLDGIDDTTTIVPKHSYFDTQATMLHAYLPSESMCTENMTPLLKLLPCKGGAGLASLIKPHAILSAEFHGVSLHVRRTRDRAWDVSVRFQAVMRPAMLGDTRWTLDKLFRAHLETTCPVARSSEIHVQSESVPEPPVGAAGSMKSLSESHSGRSSSDNDDFVTTYAGADNVDDGFSDLGEEDDDDEVAKPLVYTVPMHTYMYDARSLDAYGGVLNISFLSKASSPLVRPPPLRASRQLLGYGQERNFVRLTLRNDLTTETVHMLYYEHIPWTVLPLLHTLRADVEVDEYDDADGTVRFTDDVSRPFVVNATYKPPKVRKTMGSLELVLRVPSSSTLTVSYVLRKHMLHYDEHIPDPHRGMDLPPALFMPLGARGRAWSETHKHWPVSYVQAPRLYSTPGLLDMILPDFSMPYNVILFYSTFAALFFGTVLNQMLRRYRDVYRLK